MADTIIVGRYVGAGSAGGGRLHRNDHVSGNGLCTGDHGRIFDPDRADGMGPRMPEGVKRSVANGILLSVIAAIILTVVCVCDHESAVCI